MSDLDKEELEATRNIGKTADETENEIEKIIQFMIEDNYNISFISSIRSLMALYKTYLSLYNKEKETSHYIQSQLDIANAKLIEEKEENKSLEQENSFLKMMYRGTDEFKAIENLAKEE